MRKKLHDICVYKQQQYYMLICTPRQTQHSVRLMYFKHVTCTRNAFTSHGSYLQQFKIHCNTLISSCTKQFFCGIY